ncbi:MAG: hypothetical protein Q9221_001263 [Calogaya cf. arnoldii]
MSNEGHTACVHLRGSSVDKKMIKQGETTPRITISEESWESFTSPSPGLPDDHVATSVPVCDPPDKQSSPESEPTTGCVTSIILLGSRTLIKKENDIDSLASSVLAGKLNIDVEADSNTCLANTRRGTRCTYGIAKSSVKAARQILQQLEKGHSIKQDWKPPLDQLELLANLLLCKRSHQDQAYAVTERWVAAMDPTKGDCTFASLQVSPNPNMAHGQTINFVRSRGSGSTICIRTFVPFDSRARCMMNTKVFIEGAMRKILTPREVQKEGYIYIYNFNGNFGHVKIGVTTLTPEERLRNWQKQCGHVPELLFPKNEEDLVPIPHVYRLEKIVHAQLRNYRKKELKCRKCQKCHVEWFESSVPEAIDAVKRWSAWIRGKPYEEGSKGAWALMESQKSKVEALCWSVEEDRQARLFLQERERSRRLSVSPNRLPRSGSEGRLRCSSRLANRKNRRRSMIEGDASDAARVLTFNLE